MPVVENYWLKCFQSAAVFRKMKLQNILVLTTFNTKIRINCSVDSINIVWHALNHTGQFLSAHVTHAVGDILSAILTQWFKGYFNCAFGVFAHILVCGCDYRICPLIGDTCRHSRRQLPR